MREYIYVGDRLLAEYQPQSNQLYYYTTDQVNSVRVVTNQTGVRVFAAAYDPYGGIQKIWENSYSPELKFSGKERDSESNLDYFGARYYANYYYRWLSPDPVVNRDESMRNPQLWNLYSFCRNNPATYWDPTGDVEITKIGFNIEYKDYQSILNYTRGKSQGGYTRTDFDIEPNIIQQGESWVIKIKMAVNFTIVIPPEGDIIYMAKGLTGGPKSKESALRHEMGHFLINMIYFIDIYKKAEFLENLSFPTRAAANLAKGAFFGYVRLLNWGPRNILSGAYDLIGIPIIGMPAISRE
jgi:RHS repeat-associated protein